MEYDHSTIFTPMNSLPAKHGNWIAEESGFVKKNDMIMTIHAHGENVLAVQAELGTFRNAQRRCVLNPLTLTPTLESTPVRFGA
jgi:hypothetical protein